MATSRQETEKQVKAFLSEQWSVEPKQLTGQTRLEHDLGITGDDAEEVMEAFMDQFEVDMSEFKFNRYFGPEVGCNPAVWLWCRLFMPQLLHSEPVTIDDLVSAAMQRKWTPK